VPDPHLTGEQLTAILRRVEYRLDGDARVIKLLARRLRAERAVVRRFVAGWDIYREPPLGNWLRLSEAPGEMFDEEPMTDEEFLVVYEMRRRIGP
jgi:hypothetical protein